MSGCDHVRVYTGAVSRPSAAECMCTDRNKCPSLRVLPFNTDSIYPGAPIFEGEERLCEYSTLHVDSPSRHPLAELAMASS